MFRRGAVMKIGIKVIWFGALAMLLASCDGHDQAQAPAPQTVKAVQAATQTYSTRSAITGEVKARIQSELSFRVSGRIVERFVDVGTRVKAGEILARIDRQEQQADVEVARATVSSAEAQLTQASLASARQSSLFKNQVTTRASYDSAEEALLTAQGTLDAARAQLATATDALSFTELRADADGVITARSAEAGQVAQAAQSIFTLAHDGPRDAAFNVYESLFLEKSAGMVDISSLSTPARKMSAPVREVSPTIDSVTGTIRVKVGIDDGGDDFPLGAAVVGTFSTLPRQAFLLPWSSMASARGKPAVWVVDPTSQIVSMKPVEVAEYQAETFAVSTGLQPGDLVVVEGTKFLRPGQHVAVSSEIK